MTSHWQRLMVRGVQDGPQLFQRDPQGNTGPTTQTLPDDTTAPDPTPTPNDFWHNNVAMGVVFTLIALIFLGTCGGIAYFNLRKKKPADKESDAPAEGGDKPADAPPPPPPEGDKPAEGGEEKKEEEAPAPPPQIVVVTQPPPPPVPGAPFLPNPHPVDHHHVADHVHPVVDPHHVVDPYVNPNHVDPYNPNPFHM
ncbi:hypothetical protein MKEN_01340400 [Mycena kentingensis (nom. inval.)]|nr:hypothetical protein MKEN_01340400 [Mycena kentingensis (nom. inval.)]